MLIGAIDGGGTKVLTAVMTETGAIVARRQDAVPTADVPAYFKRCAELLEACAQEAGVTVQALDGVGMNIPGMVTPDGHVLGSPSAGWGTFHARPLLADMLALPSERLFFENDINACALAEQRFGGAGDDFVWITISTGNGGAVVANAVWCAAAAAAPVLGTSVEYDAPYPCGCGGAVVGAHASGVAIARRAVRRACPPTRTPSVAKSWRAKGTPPRKQSTRKPASTSGARWLSPRTC